MALTSVQPGTPAGARVRTKTSRSLATDSAPIKNHRSAAVLMVNCEAEIQKSAAKYAALVLRNA